MVGRSTRVATDSSGNVYITGANGNVKTVDYVTLKIDPNGKTLWTRTYNGPSNWIDQVKSLAVRPGGRVAVTGDSEGSMVTIVYDTNGVQLWQQNFSSPDPSYILTSSGVIFGPNGEVYVGGSFLVKYDANGNQVWVKPDPAVNSHGGMIYRLALDPLGNIIVIGDFESANVLKFAPDGTKLWGQSFSGGLGNLTVGSDGAVYVTGTSNGGMFTVKYDANGNKQWETMFDHTPGRCTLKTPNISATKTSVTFTITNLIKSGYSYNAAANHDPDGESNGTAITVTKP